MHWVDADWKMQRVLLDIGDLGTSATAAVIGDLWETQIKLWDLKKENLVSCVVDGAANYQAASKNHVTYNVWCHCHKLHLLAKEILCHPRVVLLFQKSKKIAKYLNKSRVSSAKLESPISQPGETRWNSAHKLFTTLIKNQEKIPDALVESKIAPFEDTDWTTIYFLEKILGQIAVCLRQLEADKVVTINLVLPLICQLKKKWSFELTKSLSFKPLMEAAIQHLNARFNFNVDNLIADSNTYLILGAFLDPRFMDLIFVENVTDRANLFDYCKNCVSTCSTTLKDSDTLDELQDFLFESGDMVIDSEIVRYLQMKMPSTNRLDLLEWWKVRALQLPTLARLARRVFSIPASSAPSERVFSRSNLIVSNLRSRLTSERAKQLTYISMNHCLVKVDEVLDW